MKYIFVSLVVLFLSACTAMQGVPMGNGHYKYISGGESKNEAFSELVSIMESTCDERGYEIIEQTVEDNGQITSHATKSKTYSVGVDEHTISKTESEYENFRGYDITTIFRCS